MAVYTDLLIENDEIATDAAGIPVLIHDRDVIAQDIRHTLRESGLLEQLIGETSTSLKKLIFKKMRILIESDSRVIPGSSAIDVGEGGALYLSASSEFGPVNWTVKK